MKFRKRNYTLVEMLVVMVIAAILISVGVPAFSKIMTGDAVGHSTSLVKGLLDQAQSKALSSRKYVAVIVDYNDTQKRGAQSIRLCFVTKAGNDFNFDRWVSDSKWYELPAGVVLDRTICMAAPDTYADLENDLQSNTDKLKAPYEMKIKLDGNSLTSSKYPALIFTKYGILPEADNALYLRLAEGILSDGNFIYTNKVANDKPANFLTLKINQFTGQTKYERP